MHKNLRKIHQQICAKIEHDFAESTEEHQQFLVRLKELSFMDRAILAEKVYQLEWAAGSPSTLESLQHVGIVDISVLLLRQSDSDSVENILNDLVERSPELLASLMGTYCCSSKDPLILKLQTQLDDFFSNLVNELMAEPNSITTNYLKDVTPYLSAFQLQQIRSWHTKLFLATTESTVAEAISKQKEWTALQKAETTPTTLSLLMTECVASDDKNVTLRELLELVSTDPNFSGWQCLLNLLTHSAGHDNHDVFLAYKMFWKDTFASCLARKSHYLFHVVMLTVRQLCCYSVANKSFDYQKWYKDTIGEMVYSNSAKLATTECFEFVMDALTEMVQYESDPDLINIHINTAIAAPPKCNELVLAFKQRSRSRLANLSNHKPMDISLIFEEDDDDDVVMIDD